ncbi:nuclear factor of activated T-cells, cytoplasmic 2 [Pimephales promelas]|uniref:nuclear factor of activated T-cells, cytoplasmic 2 n=1 Tax=Pimephales promelas TaxID=90988 RepID=UPI00195581E5|nr:nuclear factor of activated T-cells, cytoplasmic 2 [Pimephales promelas]KAG1963323.1 nuclear factor of activated T-cells, cytoplasmic 2 isoform g [Pimephales promelas]
MSNLYENIDGQEELDFPLLFLYNQPGGDLPQDDQADDSGVPSNHGSNQTSHCIHQDPSLYGEESMSQLSNHFPTDDLLTYEQSDIRQSLEHSSLFAAQAGAMQGNRPRIEITCPDLHHHDHAPTNPVNINRPMLTVPGYDMPYRENQCLSPASSTSSTSWHSDGYSPGTYSPCISPGAGEGSLVGVTEADLCPMMQAIQASGSPNTSPRTSITEDTVLDRRSSSPRSRSASPQGKRTYVQTQNLHYVRDEPTEFYPLASLEDSLNNLSNLTKPIPTKIVRPNLEYSVYTESQASLFPTMTEVKKEFAMESCYFMPANWSSQALAGVCSMPVAALPAMDWPLPSSSEQYELRIEVQPRQHHRAHYETEGSRGAVKASAGGHPVVQLRGYTGTEPLALQIFIGTADDRNLRPHAFYQVHRITGKTVTTNSQERMLSGTKILELPLEPKENMRVVVDCAGILKLRNADIELKKGETDVGRKNTRVRMIFRVHVPQPGGQWLSLQVASQTIECSQRSAHEHPAVERQDVDHCSVLGGLQMSLRGQNFTSESKVIFFEKTHVDLQIWEAEAQVYRDKSTSNLLFLEIPPYRDPNIYHPVRVSFHVLNGKKKCSQPQNFTYTPLSVPQIKAEPVEEYQYTQLGCPVRPIMGVSPPSCHRPDGCMMPTGSPYQRPQSGMYPGVPQHHLEHASIRYQIPGFLSGSPGHASCMGSTFVPNAYTYTIAGDSMQTAASLFPTLDVSELCSAGAHQKAYVSRASPTTGRSPPARSHQQTYLPVQHQRNASPVRVTVKQENLDQAYLDDVNAVIRRDLVHKNKL